MMTIAHEGATLLTRSVIPRKKPRKPSRRQRSPATSNQG